MPINSEPPKDYEEVTAAQKWAKVKPGDPNYQTLLVSGLIAIGQEERPVRPEASKDEPCGS